MRNNSSKMKVYRIQISPLRLELNMFTRFPWRAHPQTPCKHLTQTVYMYMYEKFNPSNQYHLIIPHHTLLVFTHHIITSTPHATPSPPPLTSTSPPPLLTSHHYLPTITSTPHIHITTPTPHTSYLLRLSSFQSAAEIIIRRPEIQQTVQHMSTEQGTCNKCTCTCVSVVL